MNNITKKEFYLMLENGANLLMNHREEIDRLNVFPVPDGDTGSNMSKTMLSGIESVRKKEEFSSISEMINIFSRGLLMGARGNSGVIMSQIFKGLSNGLTNVEEEITVQDLAKAFDEAKIAAYKAVINPVEGTILTVIKDMANYAVKNSELFENNPKKFLKMIYEAGLVSLKNTPELLKQLKEANVVDSGGTGLMYIISGFVKAIDNQKVDLVATMESTSSNQAALKDVDYTKLDNSLTEHFCTEFFVINIDQASFKKSEYQAELEKLGDSIVIVQDETIIKTHLHTDNPGNALQIGLRYGDLDGIKIENMRIQHTMSELEKTYLAPNTNNVYVIAVATGTQMHQIFAENGVDYIVDGGQTANPSIGDFVNAIKEAKESEIIIFPNNSNIILAAQEAAKMYPEKTIEVVPTKEYTEGFTLARLINKDYSAKENTEQLNEILSNLNTLKVTYAVKDTKFNNLEIKKGQFITILGKEIIAANDSIIDSFQTALTKLKDHEIATVFFGQEIETTEKTKVIEKLEGVVEEIEIFETNQPIYPVIISFE